MIVVTGASGLLGASVLCHARDTGRCAAGLCHRQVVHIPDTKMMSVDLTDSRAMRQMISSLQPRSIIHCAAAANVDWCEDHPRETRQINVEAPAKLAQLARELNARLLHVSTDAVFDGARGSYCETDTPAPVNVYATSKLEGERAVLERYPAAIVARVTLYGWSAQNKPSLAEWMLGELTAGRQLPGFTDVMFSPLLANDLAQILVEMLDRGLSGLYHVVGSDVISKYDFARRLAAAFGFDPDRVAQARLADSKLRAARPLDTSLNTSKITAALGRSMPDVESGLRRFRALKENGYAQQLKGALAGARA
jgi:dTDP-4-dehydrorhamnose reductase